MLLVENVDHLLEQVFVEQPLCARPCAGYQEGGGALVHVFGYLSANYLLTSWCMLASGPGGGNTERNKIRLMFLVNSRSFGGKQRIK